MRILITGTTSGIGKYLAQNLERNNRIIGIGRSDNVIEHVEFLKGDLRNYEFITYISSYIKENSIDYLIINAGVGYFGNFTNISNEQNKEILETNLLSPILLTSELLKNNLINTGIIFIGSIAGKKSMKLGASYGASKFGLRGFAMQIKNEFTNLNIHLINPKIVLTNFHNNSDIDIIGNKNYKITPLETILKTVKSILSSKETRFEIDL